jgi:hypothetical protein
MSFSLIPGSPWPSFRGWSRPFSLASWTSERRKERDFFCARSIQSDSVAAVATFVISRTRPGRIVEESRGEIPRVEGLEGEGERAEGPGSPEGFGGGGRLAAEVLQGVRLWHALCTLHGLPTDSCTQALPGAALAELAWRLARAAPSGRSAFRYVDGFPSRQRHANASGNEDRGRCGGCRRGSGGGGGGRALPRSRAKPARGDRPRRRRGTLAQAMISLTTRPWTSVSRKSRPA